MARSRRRSTRGPLDPAPEIWADLGGGKLLREVLVHFYTRVFSDDRLSHFFEHVTMQRVVDKQYSFLYSKLAGVALYFGERPRNAHHWMVVSDELFDYRERLLESSLREFGVSERAIERIRGIDEAFRKQIVKTAPIQRRLGGAVLPLEGFGTVELTAATLCDACEDAIEVGEIGTYHRRTGQTYCEACASEKKAQAALEQSRR